MDCKYFIFRNYTVEPLFDTIEHCRFSGYGAIDFEQKCTNYIWFYQLPLKTDVSVLVSEIEYYLHRFKFLVKKLPVDSNILCFTLVDIFRFKFVEGDSRLQKAVENYNDELYGLSKEDFRIRVIDIEEFTTGFRLNELFDPRHYYLSRMILNPKLSGLFSSWFLQKVKVFEGVRKKCLVLDLDNTLWGGILGEDGIEGVQLGNSYPGNCYIDFQEMILSMKKHGVILTLCSKNNLADVKEVFEKHKDMRLRFEDFSTFRINWTDKPKNIVDISKELNIGIDSMVFIDDNPVERAQAVQMLPDLIVPEFPDAPYNLVAFAMEIYRKYFSVYLLTDEDRKKTRQYLENALRKKEESLYTSKEDFLKALKMEIAVSEMNNLNIKRIAQMTQKTNQFNLTTKRYTVSDLKGMVNNGYKIWCASVKDKFGDNGITAASIIKIENDTAYIDSFLLSCRILGRGLENVFLSYLLNRLFDLGIKTVKATYIPSSKNAQAATFYEKNDFVLLYSDDNNRKYYRTELSKKINVPEIYRIIEI